MKVKAGQLCAKIDPRPYQIGRRSRQRPISPQPRLGSKRTKPISPKRKRILERNRARRKRRAISRKALNKSRKAYAQAQERTKLDEAAVAKLQAALACRRDQPRQYRYRLARRWNSGLAQCRNRPDGRGGCGDAALPHRDRSHRHAHRRQCRREDIGEVKLGDKASFTVESLPNRPFAGEVDANRPIAADEPEGRTPMTSSSRAPNPDLLLEPGMTATVEDRDRQARRRPARAGPGAALFLTRPIVAATNVATVRRGFGFCAMESQRRSRSSSVSTMASTRKSSRATCSRAMT